MIDAGFISHLAAAITFLPLTVLLLRSGKGGKPDVLLAVACGMTTVWAAVAAYGWWTRTPIMPISNGFEILRSAGWLALLWGLLVAGMRKTDAMSLVRAGPIATGTLCLLVFVISVYPDFAIILRLPIDGFSVSIFGRLAIAVVGLALVENLYRNTEPEQRWGLKHLCFGVGGLFAYDVFLYADAVLVRVLDADLVEARGAANALIIPLIVVSASRSRVWSTDIFISHRVVFHSATLIGTGSYMLLMAVVGYYLRRFGGSWGPMLQMAFLFGAAILLSLILASGRVRSKVRVVLSKHFFSYKYDYREEWLNFIRTISSTEGRLNLRERTISAIADIVDSPDGGLWLRESPGKFSLAANWNLAWPAAEESIDGALARFLEERQWVINLNEFAQVSTRYEGFTPPEWIENAPRAWLIVPLIHEEQLLGFMVLGQPRARRELNWEDYDLLKTVGHQAASYLAQEQSARALAEARQFEAFNRRFAFVMHDIKNLVSQLSLMVKNAAKFRDDPAFQEDMVHTVRDSVEKMNRLLIRLHADTAGGIRQVVMLAPLLSKIVAERAEMAPAVTFEAAPHGLAVAVDEDRLLAVIDHLIQNAVEASPEDGGVRVRLLSEDDNAVIEIEDSGPGMDARFIRDQLFQPFKTTKGAGYGIGAYESREFAREMGGRLDVLSSPGEGTTIRMSLPLAEGATESGDKRRKATA